VYVTPLTGYARAGVTDKIIGILPKAIFREIGFSAVSLQNKSSTLSMN